MNDYASIDRYGNKADGKDALRTRAFWHRLLLVAMAIGLTVCSPLPGEALNGEPVGAEGLHRAGVCALDDFDWTISCDDRSQDGVVSCHMRRAGTQGSQDEGLAINTCVEGRVTTPTAQALEIGAQKITATDFGEFVCGKESDGSSFCVVCDSFKDPEAAAGSSHCVKIVSNETLAEEPACGAFSVSKDPGGVCQSAEQELKQFFNDPHIGFSIGVNAVDASVPGAKDLLVCGSRSWQCITDRSLPLATEAPQVQQQQTHALINTPCCMRLASGAYYCSAKLTVSSTCR